MAPWLQYPLGVFAADVDRRTPRPASTNRGDCRTLSNYPRPTAMYAQTFLFADLAGFTALTEAHGDEQAADLVAEFSREAASLLPRHAGEQVKAIGDALMLRVPGAGEAI